MVTIERVSEVEQSIVGDGGPGTRSRRDEPVPPPARLSPWWSWRRQSNMADNLMGLALLGGPANIVMQLARPGVGYGVVDSKVESGRADLHPVKRARTTFTFLAVSSLGSPEQKAAFRKATNRSHAQVRSAPGDPVQYNAFDPELQKWVAICLYKGFVDVYEAFVGPMPADMAERCLQEGAVMGTTLQIRFISTITCGRTCTGSFPRPLRCRGSCVGRWVPSRDSSRRDSCRSGSGTR
jgi:hypothetical protein